MKLRLGIFLFCFFSLSQTLVWAEGIVVGVSTGYPPYYYKEDGKFTGFCVEVVNGVAESIDLKIEYREYPWKRLMHSAQQGEVDAIMPLFRTAERESFLLFDKMGLAYETNHFFAANSFDGSYQGRLENLSSYRIGVVADYSYGKQFDSFNFPSVETTQNETHLIEMFRHKRYDVGVGSRSVILFFVERAGLSGEVQFLEPPLSRETLFLAFTRKGEKHTLAAQFAAAMQKFIGSKKYSELAGKYGVIGLQ